MMDVVEVQEVADRAIQIQAVFEPVGILELGRAQVVLIIPAGLPGTPNRIELGPR